jgi:hypothetical protein
VTFPCPGCAAPLPGAPRFVSRCAACGALVRGRALDTAGERRAYDVQVVGRPETRRAVEVPWAPEDQARLRTWLVWSTAVTLGLVGVLYALARWLG